jgi:hypothetical protein
MLFHYGCVSVKAYVMDVCQWKHMYESLYGCVSCPVYIVIHLISFHYGCVSMGTSVWKFAWLCVLSCIYCHTSYVISLWVCVSDSICMKVCMIVCPVLYILSYVLCYFIMGVCQWQHLYESLHDCVSCPVYIVIRLMLFHYGCVSVKAYVMDVCQWKHMYESLYGCVSCPVYIVIHLILFHYECVSVTASVWKFAWLCVLSCIYCHTSYFISLCLKLILNATMYILVMLRRATCSRLQLVILVR